MDDIFELLSDISQQFFADSQRRSQFHRKLNKKYNATYYYQVSSYSCIAAAQQYLMNWVQANTVQSMIDADRSPVSKIAYNDFIESLEKIQHLSPLQSEFTGANVSKDTKDIPEGLNPAQLAEKATW